MLDQLPEVIVVGDIEMLFLGASLALGAPKMARKALNRRYSSERNDTDDAGGDSNDG